MILKPCSEQNFLIRTWKCDTSETSRQKHTGPSRRNNSPYLLSPTRLKNKFFHLVFHLNWSYEVSVDTNENVTPASCWKGLCAINQLITDWSRPFNNLKTTLLYMAPYNVVILCPEKRMKEEKISFIWTKTVWLNVVQCGDFPGPLIRSKFLNRT